MFAEAVAAIDRTIVLGLERNLGFLAAIGAGHGEHLPTFVAVAIASAFVATIPAPYRLILEAAFTVKFLFARAEDEFFPAVLANECFVFKSH